MRPCDYTAIAGSGKVGHVNRLTTPVGWPLLLQLTVLSRSATAVYSNFLWRFFFGVYISWLPSYTVMNVINNPQIMYSAILG